MVLSSALALPAAGVAAFLLAELAIRVALATGFVDHPVGYKGHLAATPYLGGAAVVVAFVGVSLAGTAGGGRSLTAVLGCAAALALVGTIDDRIAVAPRWRVVTEVAAAGVLFAAGVHWSVFGSGVLDFALSAAWVVGVVNAFNLMDNIDGATGTVTAVSAAALGTIALAAGQTSLAVAAFAVAGACVGFLGHNLASPARIFLGDGGSMPLGFAVAGLGMAVLGGGSLGRGAVLAGAVAAGLPILDTALVIVSRRRRGIPFVTGGRDHLTHRLLSRAGSARRVAVLLAAGQGVLAGVAIACTQLGTAFTLAAAVALAAAGAAALIVLESPAWRPRSDFERARDRELAASRFAATGTPSPPLVRARSSSANVRYSTVSEDPPRRS